MSQYIDRPRFNPTQMPASAVELPAALPEAVAQTDIPEIAAQPSNATLTWLKRGLVAGAIAGIAYGGYDTVTHYDEVKTDIIKHDKWVGVALPITEGVAWGSTPIMLVAAARELGIRKMKFK